MNRKEYYDKLRKWEAEGYDVSELRQKWFPAIRGRGGSHLRMWVSVVAAVFIIVAGVFVWQEVQNQPAPIPAPTPAPAPAPAPMITAPMLVSPYNAAADIQLRPTIVWQQVANAGGYELTISRNYDFSDIVHDVSTSLTAYQVGENLEPSTKYYWMVSAVLNPADPNTPVAYSEIWSFTTTPAPAPAPIASFDAIPTSGNAPLTVQFNDRSTGSITSRSWEFGDGSTSSAQNPSHTYTSAGLYTVRLKVTGPGGSDTATRSNYINVSSPPPVADFTASPTSGNAPLTVQFNERSTGHITSWSWDFGDGNTSIAQNPSYTYASAGTYNVRLTVIGPGGSDTKTLSNHINVLPRQVSLTVSINPPGSGTVSLDPLGGKYDSGTRVTLKASPASGYRFVSWSGDATGTSPTIMVTMDRDKNVIANFLKEDYQVIIKINVLRSFVITKELQAGDMVDGSIKVDSTALMNNRWGYRIIALGGKTISQWEGSINYKEFGFTAEYTGTYSIEVYQRESWYWNYTVRIWPPGWR